MLLLEVPQDCSRTKGKTVGNENFPRDSVNMQLFFFSSVGIGI